jgi:hypothetical protein
MANNDAKVTELPEGYTAVSDRNGKMYAIPKDKIDDAARHGLKPLPGPAPGATVAPQVAEVLQRAKDAIQGQAIGGLRDVLGTGERGPLAAAKAVAGSAVSPMGPGFGAVKALSALVGPNPGSLVAGRAYQGMNPVAAGGAGEKEFDNPQLDESEAALRRGLGPTGSAALQTAANVAPQALPMLGGAAKKVGELSAGEMVKRILPTALTGAGANAGLAALGAPKGQELDAARDAVASPQGVAMTAAGGLLGLHGGPPKLNEAELMSQVLNRAKQQLSQQRDTTVKLNPKVGVQPDVTQPFEPPTNIIGGNVLEKPPPNAATFVDDPTAKLRDEARTPADRPSAPARATPTPKWEPGQWVQSRSFTEDEARAVRDRAIQQSMDRNPNMRLEQPELTQVRDRALEHAARYAVEHPEDWEGRQYVEQMAGGAGKLKPTPEGGREFNPFEGTRYDPKGPGSYEPTVRADTMAPTLPPVGDPMMPPIRTLDGHELVAQESAAQSAASKGKAWLNDVAKFLVHPADRAAPEAAMGIREWEAAQGVRDFTLQRTNGIVKKAVGEGIGKQVAREFTKAVLAKDNEGARELLTKLPVEYRKLFDVTMRRRDHIFSEMLKRGYLAPEEAVKFQKVIKDSEPWLHAEYMKVLDKSWKPPVDAVEDAAMFLVKEHQLPYDEARNQIHAFLREVQDGQNPAKAYSKSTLARDVLKQKTLPKFLQPVLGLVDDPAFALSNSIAELERMHHQMRVTEALTAPDLKGKVWSDKPVKGWDERAIGYGMSYADARKAFGGFAGKYAPREVYEALNQVPGGTHQNMVMALVSKLSNEFRATKVLGSVTTLLRNLLSNSMYMTALDPRATLRVKDAMEAVHLYGKNYLAPSKGPAVWMRWALEDGAVQAGRGAEARGVSGEAQSLAKELSAADHHPLLWPLDAWTKYKRWAGGIYELADTVPRLASYMHEVKAGLDNGLSTQEARARAASQVRRYYASGSQVGYGVKQLSQGLGGILNPFLSWHVDNVRVARNILRDASQGRFGPLIRSSMWWGVPFAAAAGLRQLQGVSDADVAAAEAKRPLSHRGLNPLGFWFRGPDKQMYWASTEAFNPFATWLKGDPTLVDQSPGGQALQLGKRVATNIARGSYESGLLEPWADDLMAGMGAPIAKRPEYGPLPGEANTERVLRQVWETMSPTMMRQFSDILRRTGIAGKMRPTEEPMDAGEAALKAMGVWDTMQVFKPGLHTQASAIRQERGTENEDKRVIAKTAVRAERAGSVDSSAPVRAAAEAELKAKQRSRAQRSTAQKK